VEATDPKIPVVRIKVGAPLKAQPTLAEMKASRVFHDSPLVRQARLSVVPLTEEQYKVLTAA
jgi:predicted RNA-binding protein with PUA-like domain